MILAEASITIKNKEAFNMKGSNPREIPFNGIRLSFDSNKRFDDALSSVAPELVRQKV